MVWTTVAMPKYLAQQYDTTQYIVLEGSQRDVLGYVAENYVPVDHDSVYVREHGTYTDALRFAFEKPQFTEAVGVTNRVLDVDVAALTIVLESER